MPAPTPSSTVENYLKALYVQQQRLGVELVPLGRLAEALGVTPGTVTTMVNRLADAGYVRYTARRGAALSARGEKLALRVLRRHRLIELFLVEVLGYDWTEVHDDAEVLEHAVSDKLLERIDRMLGSPTVDPHGDPIPAVSGAVADTPVTPLSEAPLGPVTIARVGDQDARFLTFLDAQGLTPGQAVTLTARDPAADLVTLAHPAGHTLRLSTAAAAKIDVHAKVQPR